MTKSLVLMPQAIESLGDIAGWTIERFGQRQALAYRAILDSRFASVANGVAARRPLSQLTERPEHEEVLLASAGRHLIMFVEDADSIYVLDVVHQRRDLSRLAFPDDPANKEAQ
ncbi:MAG: type II toxin-antitoxin system RelE/ParE family toxin [Paracoccaceae bacterium]|nr:type II toxin-antitoxin system RelE/ParE family toxin [Paracoccaceae bacterium]